MRPLIYAWPGNEALAAVLARELSAEIGQSVANTSFHLRTLAKFGFLPVPAT